jgi:hypothetical protein
MLCTSTEFFLLLKRWLTTSQRLLLAFTLGEPPLSRVTMGHLFGSIVSIDEEAKFFVFGIREASLEEGFLMVGFDGCTFGWVDEEVLRASDRSSLTLVPEVLEEIITIDNHATGTRFTLAAFTPS